MGRDNGGVGLAKYNIHASTDLGVSYTSALSTSDASVYQISYYCGAGNAAGNPRGVLRSRRAGAPVRMADDEDAPDPKEVLAAAKARFKKSVVSVQEQLSSVRVGKASPALLDKVMVNYYGAETPLNQLAMVTAPQPTMLMVDPFDKSCIADIEKALFESDVGMTPNNDGKCIRLNVPQLTGERRTELGKLVKKRGEDGKTSIRNIRKAEMDKLKKMKKAIGEDAFKDAEDELQKSVKKFEGDIEKLVSDREKDILGK
jgi:ribosome recycling factor